MRPGKFDLYQAVFSLQAYNLQYMLSYSKGIGVTYNQTNRSASRYIFVTLVFGCLALFNGNALASNKTGNQLFHANCAACHGNQGNGGVGVPLSLPAFINTVDDNYIRQTIQNGRPGRIMPSFAHLSASDIDKIIHYIRTWTGVHPAPYSDRSIAGDPVHGKALFQKNCAACHGVNGEGGHGTGVTFSRPRDLPILAPALNNRGFLAAASDEMIKHTLMNGREGTPMISFLKAGLSESDINDVVAYVRSFETHMPGRPLADENEPPMLVVESPFTVEETVKHLKEAVVSANMRLIRVQYLDDGFVDKGKENKKRVIVYSCGFNFLNEALKVDPRVGLFLPCRVTVVKHHDKVLVMSVNPKRLAYLFNNNELSELCSKMKKTYSDLMEEATF